MKQFSIGQALSNFVRRFVRVFWRSLTFFHLIVPTILGQAGEAQSTIHFQNGDWLRGTMAAYDQVNGVTWSHADVADTMRFNISQITGIALAGAAAGKIGSGNLSCKTLNGR